MGAMTRHPSTRRDDYSLGMSIRMFALALLVGSVGVRSARADELKADSPADAAIGVEAEGPIGESRLDLMGPHQVSPEAMTPEVAWRLAPSGAGPRGSGGPAPLFDNGQPLDDGGDPASQMSLAVDGAATVWRFYAAAADDFILPDSPTDPGSNYRINTIRVAFEFFQSGAASATPLTTWTQGVYVTIYENSALNQPAGAPALVGGDIVFTGNVVATTLVPNALLMNQVLVDTGCRQVHQIDIPVDFVLAADTRYWLSVAPRYPAPPQSGWALSAMGTAGSRPAHRGASFDVPFWTVINGNTGSVVCSPGAAAGTIKELSFQIYADTLQQEVGACCNSVTGVCTDVDRGIDPNACMDVDETFSPGELCALLSPACDEGACCYTDGFGVDQCVVTTSLDCQNTFFGHTFEMSGVCTNRDCTRPPPQDDCAQAPLLSGNNIFEMFNTTNATTNPASPATQDCGQIVRDVWYNYSVACTGTVLITTVGSSFDTVLAVYGNGTAVCSACPVDNSEYLDCNDDNPLDPGTDYSILAIPGRMTGECLKIRIGGKPGAALEGGPGVLRIFCVPDDQGACCRPDAACSLEFQSDCLEPNRWYPGEPCGSPTTCLPNDNCTSAQPLPGLKRVMRPFNTTRATTGSIPPSCGTIQQDIWFSYTAQCSGDVVITTRGSLYDTFLVVYDFNGGLVCPDGSLCSDLAAREIACNDDTPSDPLARIRLTGVVAGDCLLIRVGGHDNGFGLSGGEGLLSIDCIAPNEGACCFDDGSPCDIVEDIDCVLPNMFFLGEICEDDLCPTPPDNDDCVDATVLPSTSPLIEAFDTSEATTEMDAALTTCGPVLSDVWYQYVAPCDGTLIITTATSGFDTALAVYGQVGMCPAACPLAAPTGNFTELACNDDVGGGDLTSHVVVLVTTGDCLLIRVGGHETSPGVGAEGVGQLNIECSPLELGACCHADRMCESPVVKAVVCENPGDQFFPGEVCNDMNCPPLPPNDECDGAIALVDGVAPFDTTLATTSLPAITPTPACPAPEMDLWYSYEASCTGLAKVALCGGTNFDSVVAIYDGCACPPVNAPIACDDNGCGPDGASEVVFPVVMGNCYLIRIGGVAGAAGAGMIEISCDDTMQPCCKGDADGNGVVNVADVQAFVDALLNADSLDMMDPLFCRSDINDDMVLDALDISVFVISLLDGTMCDPLSQGACCLNDGSCTIGTQDACVMSGGTYHGNNSDCSPNPCPQPPMPPPNDDCANATPLVCGVPVMVNNMLGTTIASDPAFSCRFGGPAQGVGTVWFTFVATDTDALISTCDSVSPVVDTILAVYDGACPLTEANEIACSEDAGGACGRLSQVCVDGLVIGNTYRVQVASYDAASKGVITVELTCPCPFGACCLPDGTCEERRSDDCLAAGGSFKGEGVPCTPLPCVPPPSSLACCIGDFSGDGQINEQDIAGFVDALISPPVFGTQSFCRADANGDAMIDGQDVAGFVAVALAGLPCAAPANDACDAAALLNCGDRVLVENNYASTAPTDPGFTCRAGGPGQGAGTLWFAFEASATTAHVSTCDSLPPASDTIVAVYSAECPTAVSQLACSEDAGGGCGRLSDLCVGGLVPGTLYYVQVSSFDSSTLGFISLLVECPCP